VLSSVSFAVGGLDGPGERVAGRMVNLAIATTERSLASIVEPDSDPRPNTRVVLRISGGGTTSALPGRPVVSLEGDSLPSRLLTAVSSSPDECPEVVVEMGISEGLDERDEQRAAIVLLDAVCALFD